MAGDGGGIGPGKAPLFGALEHPVNIVNAAISNVPVIFVVIVVSDVAGDLCRLT
jgi:hypothetical protein